jgi:hypothetical protein
MLNDFEDVDLLNDHSYNTYVNVYIEEINIKVLLVNVNGIKRHR